VIQNNIKSSCVYYVSIMLVLYMYYVMSGYVVCDKYTMNMHASRYRDAIRMLQL